MLIMKAVTSASEWISTLFEVQSPVFEVWSRTQDVRVREAIRHPKESVQLLPLVLNEPRS